MSPVFWPSVTPSGHVGCGHVADALPFPARMNHPRTMSSPQIPPVEPFTKGVTQRDVARIAGVNQNTVSVALSGRSGRARVSPETKARIQEIARSLGYTPNLLARSLTLSRAETIGLYCSRHFGMNAPWSAMVFAGMQEGCVKHGMDLLLHGIRLDHDTGGCQHGYRAAKGKVDGMIVYTDPADPMLPALRGMGVGLVSIAHQLPGIVSVVDDAAGGMRTGARHLHQRGHRRVIFRDFGPIPTPRCLAFCAEARTLGMQVQVVVHDYSNKVCFQSQEEVLLDLHNPDRCTAIVGGADSMVAPVMWECQRRGWRIPQDLAVMGFDGVSMSMLHQVPPRWQLTTLRVDWWSAAETAVGLLVDLLNGRPVADLTTVPATLVEGDTV